MVIQICTGKTVPMRNECENKCVKNDVCENMGLTLTKVQVGTVVLSTCYLEHFVCYTIFSNII